MGPISLILLFIVGIAAVIAEMFVPGVIVGICGAACMIASVVMAYNDDHKTLGHVLLGTGIFSVPILVVIWYKIFSKKFSISESEEGFSATNDELNELVSCEGVAVTPLHPSGIALIAGKRVDVVTTGRMVEKDAKIKVVEVEGNRVAVKQMNENNK